MKGKKTEPRRAPARLSDLTLTELNGVLPAGWRATLLKLAKNGEFEPALIQSLGLDLTTFYRLKRENTEFQNVLNECTLWRLTFWHGIQKAMIFGDIAPKTQQLLIRILSKLEGDFDGDVKRIEGDGVQKNDYVGLAELRRAETNDLRIELQRRGVDVGDVPLAVENNEKLEGIKESVNAVQLTLNLLSDFDNATPAAVDALKEKAQGLGVKDYLMRNLAAFLENALNKVTDFSTPAVECKPTDFAVDAVECAVDGEPTERTDAIETTDGAIEAETTDAPKNAYAASLWRRKAT